MPFGEGSLEPERKDEDAMPMRLIGGWSVKNLDRKDVALGNGLKRKCYSCRVPCQSELS